MNSRKRRLAAVAMGLWLTITAAQAAEIPVLAYSLQDTQMVGIPGAVFTLTTSEGRPVAFRPEGQAWSAAQNGETALTTGSDGLLYLTNLAPGQYLLYQRDAPGLYRRMDRPVALQLLADGTLLADGAKVRQAAILHRSGFPVLAAAALAVFALLPAAVRWVWLWRNKGRNS